MLTRIDERGRCWEVSELPFSDEFDIQIARLSDEEYEAICNKLEQMINESKEKKEKIFVSSWMPGSDWSKEHDGVFHPIYAKACAFNDEQAAMLFGNILKNIVIHREDKWMAGRFEDLARGLCYWDIDT